MIEVISSGEKDRLAVMLERIRNRNIAFDEVLLSKVSAIMHDVRTRGDAALIDFAAQFDRCVMQTGELRVDEDELRRTAAGVPPGVLEAIREAIRRVRAFHHLERPQSWVLETSPGVFLGQRITPVERAGLYVPGGSAGYPSSVVMNVVPAQVAGVGRLVVATPPRTLQENPAVAAALIELNVTEVYAVGGAQAIAALAFGTETVPRVDKITGPGNSYVAAAKKLIFGVVGIDSIAGPSEVAIIADQTAQAAYVASDLLAQAEHSEDASAILLTTSYALALKVVRELEIQTATLSRAGLIKESLLRYGAIIVVEAIEEACAIVNELAPEHLQIMARDEEELAARITNAGAIFFGSHSPAAIGDYLAGPNHVLPSGGTARFSSGLGVHDFLKRSNTVKFSASELERTAPSIAAIARAEGFDAHARSVLIRQEENRS